MHEHQLASGTASTAGAGTAELAEGEILTVTGPVPAGELGPILPMEHLLADFTAALPAGAATAGSSTAAGTGTATAMAEDSGFYHRPVSIEILGDLALVRANRENLTLTDPDLARYELNALAQNPGCAVVDATSYGLGRDPAGLHHLSNATGVPIVTGCGWYHPSLCPQIAARSAENLAAEMIGDLTEGQDGLRAGLIGRLGALDPDIEADRRILTAAARASTCTGAAILIDHRDRPQARGPALRHLLQAGTDAGRIAVTGLGDLIAEPAELEPLAGAGHYLLFDRIGSTGNVYTPWDHLGLAATLAHLIGAGLERHLLLSHGLSRRSDYRAYGGPGLGFLRQDFAMVLSFIGIETQQLEQICTRNPRRLLCRTTPNSGGSRLGEPCEEERP